METEEDEIRTRLPEIHSIIAASSDNINWSEIHDDFEHLNWLNFDMAKAMTILESALDIIDLVSLLDSNETSRYNVLQHNRVILFLNRLVFELTNDKKSLKLLCAHLKKKISSFIFFKSGKNALYHIEDEDLVPFFKSLHESFQSMKETLLNIFSHLDSIFKQETYKSLDSYLTEEFNTDIILNRNSTLRQIPEIKKIISEKYDKPYSHSSGIRTNGGMWSGGGMGSYYSSNRENDYFGELDVHGNRQGYGKITFFNGDKYDGYWKDDNMHGIGIYFWKEGGRYEGEFHDGKMQGHGKRIYPSGNIYEGDLVNNKKEGKGSMKFKNGDQYEGDWKDDDMHGEGIYSWSTGDVYRGRFQGDRREGKGTLTLASGEVYEAEWRDDKMMGRTNII
ncbi:unnamed protein product [Blepharisma stoltei]|uniref:MORN repeat-containing protein n=1 Tax=Blepharisma stoltei TaxID=1481888 RepID=A0AAU9K4E2_9CILI|nr:unnamed protein product [Blepharisma stoltei]